MRAWPGRTGQSDVEELAALLMGEVQQLWETMAKFVKLLSNHAPLYAAYHTVNMVKLVALNKELGVRPVGIGEVWMRLWANCAHEKTKNAPMIACGNTQLCAGQRSGIEANLHAVQRFFSKSNGWTWDTGDKEEEEEEEEEDTQEDNKGSHNGGRVIEECPVRPFTTFLLAPHGVDPCAALDQSSSRCEPDTGFCCALFDARNGFNELNRYMMLWTVAHQWNGGSWFAINRYCHHICCIVQ